MFLIRKVILKLMKVIFERKKVACDQKLNDANKKLPSFRAKYDVTHVIQSKLQE